MAHLESQDSSCCRGESLGGQAEDRRPAPERAAQTGGQGHSRCRERRGRGAGGVRGRVKVSSSGLIPYDGALGQSVCRCTRVGGPVPHPRA